MKSVFSFLRFAAAIFLMPQSAHASEPGQAEILREANRALSADEFVKATQLLYAAREQIVSRSGGKRSDEDVYQLIQINRSIAEAMAGGEFGDVCKPLVRANDNLFALATRVGTERRHPYERPMSLASRQIQQAIVKYDCAQKTAQKPDPGIAGIYYLRGVMETASGLKLDQNGRYEWYLAVGSLDLTSKGVWHRKGDHIQLISDQANEDPKIVTATTEIPFAPRTGEVDEFIKLPDNPNYSIIFKSSQPDSYPSRAFALFGYADGREEMAGPVSYGRLDVELDEKDLPVEVRLIFSIQEQMIEVKTGIAPEPGIAHELTVRRPGMRELGVSTMVLEVDGDILKSPMVSQKGAYVKAKPRPKP